RYQAAPIAISSQHSTWKGDGTASLTGYYAAGSLYIQFGTEGLMAKALTSLRLDDRLVRRAQKVLGAKSRTQTIEMSLEAVVETEKHRKLIKRYSGKARPGDFDRS
ncbi:MAG: hypothetical protein ACM3SP_12365, partial [Chloroflexota bacterium]